MKVGIHRIAVSIYIAGMDAIFDDLSNAIREPVGMPGALSAPSP